MPYQDLIKFLLLQRGVGDKAVNQLERSVNSRLEATVGRQIQAQFQTSGKHALQVLPISTCRSLLQIIGWHVDRSLINCHRTIILFII